MTEPVRHYINLTNGLECPHISTVTWKLGPARRFTRIQSSHCEAKNWPGVIYGAGPDLLLHAALGWHVVVHDKSEKDRETRAMWQGLTFIRRTCETLWELEKTEVTGRGGWPMAAYFDQMIQELDKPVRAYIKYFWRYLATYKLDLNSCYERKEDGH